jgi:hypothetical protein
MGRWRWMRCGRTSWLCLRSTRARPRGDGGRRLTRRRPTRVLSASPVWPGPWLRARRRRARPQP